MKTLRRIFSTLALLWRGVPIVEAPRWEVEDARYLKLFLDSATGRKFAQAMIAEIAVQNERAVATATPQACGQAQGFRLFWGMWQNFSTFACQPADRLDSENVSEHGPLAELAHMSP